MPAHLDLVDQAAAVVAAFHAQDTARLRREIERLAALLTAEPRPRLTEDEVRTIRARYAAGERQASIAVDYGITRTHVSGIVTLRSWRNVA